MAKFERREVAPPKKTRPLRIPDAEGKWVKPSQETALPPGAQSYAVAVTGLTADELTAKIEEVEASGREFLINVIPKDLDKVNKWGKKNEPRLMHPLFIERNFINAEAKHVVVCAVELPQWEREQQMEKNQKKLEEAKKVAASLGYSVAFAPAAPAEADADAAEAEQEYEPG